MTLLERENAIRKLLGEPLAERFDEDTRLVRCGTPFYDLAYYGEIDSIGIVLRDVVPRLWSGKFQPMLLQRDDKSWGVYAWDKWEGDHDLLCSFPDLASMPAACCDALLKKEGLLP